VKFKRNSVGGEGFPTVWSTTSITPCNSVSPEAAWLFCV